MDGLEQHNVWAVILFDRLDQLVSAWHTHRTVIVSAILVVLFAIRFTLRAGTRSKDSNSLSRPPSPALKHPDPDNGALAQAGQFQQKSEALRGGPKIVSGRRPMRRDGQAQKTRNCKADPIQPIIIYSTLTGTSEKVAEDVSAALQPPVPRLDAEPHDTYSTRLPPIVKDIAQVELDEWFISGPKPLKSSQSPARFVYILVIPSYNVDSLLDTFLDHLKETHNDFRIDTAPLSSLAGYCVFGIGDKEGWPSVEEGFCDQAIQVDKWMARLTGGKRAYPLGMGDVKGDLRSSVSAWTRGVGNTLRDISLVGSLGDGVPGSGDAVESDEEDVEDFADLNPRKKRKRNQVTDLEDVKGPSPSEVKTPLPVDFTTTSSSSTESTPAPKQMVPINSPTHAALTKQGYTIIGGHSGVKICRWTKSALRGRGSCYKNSFYGIASHLCMETTPSLSCSNKCVFCWRHGTNPVSTTWRWEVDPPEMIFRDAKEGHYKKIKHLRGVPGVIASRFEEAMRIRHCALSLVGEPIFYPRINEFVALLHGERISSFLVCNAQHPDQLAALDRVTQLYVSIDASNRESLRKIDRPLHRDFWERFTRCLDILREKRFLQRTVFRLTLVKGFNIEDEVEGYADLVSRGLPCFVEIKGVTYCGTSTSKAAGLTMQNVPFYEEVVAFAKALDSALAKRGLEYGIAAEHAHSCCVLLASRRFWVDGKWMTRIDYERFFELLEKEKEKNAEPEAMGEAEGEGDRFRPEDYCAPTPEWALFGNGGFDPRDVRVDRKGRPILLPIGDEKTNLKEDAGSKVVGI